MEKETNLLRNTSKVSSLIALVLIVWIDAYYTAFEVPTIVYGIIGLIAGIDLREIVIPEKKK